MTEFYNLIQRNGPGVLIIFAILLFGKKIIEHFFSEMIEFKRTELNQQLENYKTKLEQENKNFQYSLDIKLNEFNIQFSKLHQERADVIKNLYYKIVELQAAMTVFTRRLHIVIENADNEERVRLERVNNALNEFIKYYMPNKIFFDKKLAKKLDNIANQYWNKSYDFSQVSKALKSGDISRELYDAFSKTSKDISEIVKNEYPKLIEELEKEFRKILGVK